MLTVRVQIEIMMFGAVRLEWVCRRGACPVLPGLPAELAHWSFQPPCFLTVRKR